MDLVKHCTHLKDSIGINRDTVKSKKTKGDQKTECLDCKNAKDNWLCLKCGGIYCSRYVNEHAKLHSESASHLVSMSINTTSVFCYACNEFVMNDDEEDELNDIRSEIHSFNDMNTSDSEVEEASTKSSNHPHNHQHQQHDATSSTSTSSYDSGLDSLPSVSGINLRPRKRTKSDDEDTAAPKNSKKKMTEKRKGVGLKNLGNTCFMNSVLQSLHNIREFTFYFSNLPKMEQTKPRLYTRSIKENLDEVFLIEELRKVLVDLNSGIENNKSAVSPECLFLCVWKVAPLFRGYHQHDAHEFLRYMLDRLHTELQSVSGAISQTATNSKMKNFVCPTTAKKGSSFVTSIFGGTLLSEVKCLICGGTSKKHDPFLDLSLDIPEKYYNVIDETSDNKKPECHISDCLSSFVAVEELTETELYYCSNCKKKQKSTKRFWIRRLPNVLCLHIKRFRWNSYYRTKIDLQIKFPIQALDLTKFVLNNGPETRRSNSNSIYDLAAVIVHHGSGTSNGHYTAYANTNGSWLHFNDSSVKEVTEQVVANCKPYILFYTKRDGE
ncbi:hypothetical protein PVAND_011490 [Polypedilum vanderplanki]|uniref:Ubiquitin carboxyl-terminal hydrolase n=1 Tax=Polypedilum vanderplanki TaxID=319348 RepID=A0A9J6CJR4_POLVA|nr:hypothetical protein PVAND_011490 [Polypedilum vanderplanki]